MAALGWGNKAVDKMLATGHEEGPMFNPSNKTPALQACSLVRVVEPLSFRVSEQTGLKYYGEE